ncbi:uncharacterized protein [Cherax quadricarinatus]|uniref:uncharacterized protein n=1 Tax=Cherax quadricarinatus TaxID=27406 RepID=UPI00387EE476
MTNPTVGGEAGEGAQVGVRGKEPDKTKRSNTLTAKTSLTHSISKTQLKELREAFRLFDKDGDGTITKQELGQFMRNLGQFATEEELRVMLDEIDIDDPRGSQYDSRRGGNIRRVTLNLLSCSPSK